MAQYSRNKKGILEAEADTNVQRVGDHVRLNRSAGIQITFVDRIGALVFPKDRPIFRDRIAGPCDPGRCGARDLKPFGPGRASDHFNMRHRHA